MRRTRNNKFAAGLGKTHEMQSVHKGHMNFREWETKATKLQGADNFRSPADQDIPQHFLQSKEQIIALDNSPCKEKSTKTGGPLSVLGATYTRAGNAFIAHLYEKLWALSGVCSRKWLSTDPWCSDDRPTLTTGLYQSHGTGGTGMPRFSKARVTPFYSHQRPILVPVFANQNKLEEDFGF